MLEFFSMLVIFAVIIAAAYRMQAQRAPLYAYQLSTRTREAIIHEIALDYVACIARGYSSRDARAHARGLLHSQYNLDNAQLNSVLKQALADAHLMMHIKTTSQV